MSPSTWWRRQPRAVETFLRALSESGFDRAAYRESLIDFVVTTGATASVDPLATKQRSAVVETLAANADELTSGTLDKGTVLVNGFVETSRGTGGDVAEGAAESMLATVGSFMRGSNNEAAAARRRKRLRRLSESNCDFTNSTNATNSTNGTACSDTGDDAIIAQAAARNDELRNTTGTLTKVIGLSLTSGEEPRQVLSPDLSMRVGKADGCALERAPFGAPSATGSDAGFTLPAGTTCVPVETTSRRRRLSRPRRLSEGSSSSTTTSDSTTDGSSTSTDDTSTAPPPSPPASVAEVGPEVETAFTAYTVNPYQASADEELATG